MADEEEAISHKAPEEDPVVMNDAPREEGNEAPSYCGVVLPAVKGKVWGGGGSSRDRATDTGRSQGPSLFYRSGAAFEKRRRAWLTGRCISHPAGARAAVRLPEGCGPSGTAPLALCVSPLGPHFSCCNSSRERSSSVCNRMPSPGRVCY